jgi:hypothetical protein
MGLQAVFQNAAVAAFNAAGDIVKVATYRIVSDNELETSPIVSLPFRIMLNGFTIRERKESETILADDVKGVTPSLSLGMRPSVGAEIDVNAETYTVVALLPGDAAEAVYTMQLRKA